LNLQRFGTLPKPIVVILARIGSSDQQLCFLTFGCRHCTIQ
jgi:hypothetical protein